MEPAPMVRTEDIIAFTLITSWRQFLVEPAEGKEKQLDIGQL